MFIASSTIPICILFLFGYNFDTGSGRYVLIENFPSIPHDVPEGNVRHALMEDFLYTPCDVSETHSHALHN